IQARVRSDHLRVVRGAHAHRRPARRPWLPRVRRRVRTRELPCGARAARPPRERARIPAPTGPGLRRIVGGCTPDREDLCGPSRCRRGAPAERELERADRAIPGARAAGRAAWSDRWTPRALPRMRCTRLRPTRIVDRGNADAVACTATVLPA